MNFLSTVPRSARRPRTIRVAWASARSRVHEMVTAELCPWLDKYLAAVRHPLTALIAAALAAVLCGFFAAPQGFLVAAVIGFVIVVGLAWPLVTVRGLQGEFRFNSHRGQEGAPLDVRITIRNRWPWPIWGVSIEGGLLAQELPEDARFVSLDRIAGWSRCEFQWDFTPAVRGRYPKSAPQLVSGFPFGLWRARRSLRIENYAVVWPATFSLPSFRRSGRRAGWRGAPNAFQAGNDGDCIGARPFREGDSLRSIHWALTARHDRLITREREFIAQSAVAIDVDVSPEAHTGEGPQSSREWSVRIAASICRALLAEERTVQCRLERQSCWAHPGGGDLKKLMDWLATFDDVEGAEPPHDARQMRSEQSGVSDRIFVGTDRSHSGLTSSGSSTLLPILIDTRRKRPVSLERQDVVPEVIRAWRTLGGGTVL